MIPYLSPPRRAASGARTQHGLLCDGVTGRINSIGSFFSSPSRWPERLRRQAVCKHPESWNNPGVDETCFSIDPTRTHGPDGEDGDRT